MDFCNLLALVAKKMTFGKIHTDHGFWENIWYAQKDLFFMKPKFSFNDLDKCNLVLIY